jgi:hypothetical protein
MEKKELQNLGERWYELRTFLIDSKARTNNEKLLFGLNLDRLQDLYYTMNLEGVEELGTYEMLLAELHLTKARTVRLVRNARFVRECKVPIEDYPYLDSSVIELFRKHDKNPVNYMDDIKTLSYYDLEQLLSPQEEILTV